MQSIIQLIVLTFCLVCLAFYFLTIVSKMSKLTRSSGSRETMLQRILGLIKESTNVSRAKP